MLDKALARGADAVIVDLEDSVPAAGKASARAAVARWMARQDPAARCAIWVRVNPGPAGLDDARAVAAPALRGLCLAKCGGVAHIDAVDAVLTARERELGVEVGRVKVAPLLEDAAAVLAAPTLARGPRVIRLQIGEADLCAELGIEPGEDERELLAIRTRVVLASAAAGIEPPVGPVSTVYRDHERLRRTTEGLRRLGYRSRACIHPDQIATVHEVFTPTGEELDRAAALVARFDAAVRAGAAVLVDDEGRMIDEAVVRGARRVLATGALLRGTTGR